MPSAHCQWQCQTQYHSPSHSHSLCHSHSHSQAIVRVSIVTCCNKLKLTKSVRSHWGCQSDWLPPPAPAAAAAATCGVQLVEQLAGSACSHLALARLDNKCQHFAAANLFARLMRAPIAGGPCFYVAATAVAPSCKSPYSCPSACCCRWGTLGMYVCRFAPLYYRCDYR